MSLTSYRAAPPRGRGTTEGGRVGTAGGCPDRAAPGRGSERGVWDGGGSGRVFRRPTSVVCGPISVLCRPGDDLLSHVLRQSTIGAKAFDGRVRDGIGSDRLARAARPAKNGRRRARTTDDGKGPVACCPTSVGGRSKTGPDDRAQMDICPPSSVLRRLKRALERARAAAPWRREQSSRTSD